LLRAMQGLPQAALAFQSATLAHDIAANGPRAHYMRAKRTEQGVKVAKRQDSGLLSVLSGADTLVVRPPNDPARMKGETVRVLPY